MGCNCAGKRAGLAYQIKGTGDPQKDGSTVKTIQEAQAAVKGTPGAFTAVRA